MRWRTGMFTMVSLIHASTIFGAIAAGGTVIDQIAVVVGKHAIKASDIDSDLRVTQFLNNDAPGKDVAQQRAAAQRLIDQELIRTDLVQSGNAAQLTNQADALLTQIRNDRFKGSQPAMESELRKRGLSAQQLHDRLQWQLVVLRFIDERFRPGVIVSDEDVRSFFDKHKAELRRQYPKDNSFETLSAEIREQLEGERINASFEEWLQQARKAARIDYKVDVLK